jgi:hypothetical protein
MTWPSLSCLAPLIWFAGLQAAAAISAARLSLVRPDLMPRSSLFLHLPAALVTGAIALAGLVIAIVLSVTGMLSLLVPGA